MKVDECHIQYRPRINHNIRSYIHQLSQQLDERHRAPLSTSSHHHYISSVSVWLMILNHRSAIYDVAALARAALFSCRWYDPIGWKPLHLSVYTSRYAIRRRRKKLTVPDQIPHLPLLPHPIAPTRSSPVVHRRVATVTGRGRPRSTSPVCSGWPGLAAADYYSGYYPDHHQGPPSRDSCLGPVVRVCCRCRQISKTAPVSSSA